MSEHELWNELGNLYFISGVYKQAEHAYKKSIKLDSSFGKPISNLALLYTKQAKYEDAIQLYKKSLALLTDDEEKAITWNRLGNVYRQQKNYKEAVVAYQCADDFRSNKVNFNEQSNQMPYVLTESGYLLYEIGEEKQNHHNHSLDFMIGSEPEFNKELPEFAPIGADVMERKYQINQKTNNGWSNENLSEPVSVIGDNEEDETFQVESKTNYIDESNEHNVSEKNFTKEVTQKPADIVMSKVEAASLRADTEVASELEASTILKVENSSKEDAMETHPLFSEHIAQSDEIDTTLSDNSHSMLSESDDSLVTDTPARDCKLTELTVSGEEDVEELPNELRSTTAETDSHSDIETSEENIDVTESINLVENETDNNEEYAPDLVESIPPIDAISQTTTEELHGTVSNLGAEEEKLAKQIEINPHNPTSWEALGTLYKAAGRYEEAVQAFEQAVSIAPKTASYYHNLGLVYSVSGNNEGALKAFQKVLELNPNHSLTHASLGGYYKKIGLEELAQHHIGKAMKYIYESENEYNRACLEAICGNSAQAIELLRTALEKKQTYVDWVLHDPDLDSLRDDEGYKQLLSDFSK